MAIRHFCLIPTFHFKVISWRLCVSTQKFLTEVQTGSSSYKIGE
nr:MAG TPA: hypothetical protein [Caudoviricetes sp.]